MQASVRINNKKRTYTSFPRVTIVDGVVVRGQRPILEHDTKKRAKSVAWKEDHDPIYNNATHIIFGEEIKMPDGAFPCGYCRKLLPESCFAPAAVDEFKSDSSMYWGSNPCRRCSTTLDREKAKKKKIAKENAIQKFIEANEKEVEHKGPVISPLE